MRAIQTARNLYLLRSPSMLPIRCYSSFNRTLGSCEFMNQQTRLRFNDLRGKSNCDFGLFYTRRLCTNHVKENDNAQSGSKPSSLTSQKIKVTFIRASGERIETSGNPGDSLLDVVVNNDIDLDGFGACEGTLSCSTCHLIFSQDDFDNIPNKANDEELDMLDLAFDLTDTLGCQVILTKEFDGLEVRVPATVNDVRAS